MQGQKEENGRPAHRQRERHREGQKDRRRDRREADHEIVLLVFYVKATFRQR